MKTITSHLVYRQMAIVLDKHSYPNLYPNCDRTQAGVVLVLSLIILLLLTIIGLSAMQTTALEEKMAGNLRDKSLAFQAAESALRAAELILPSISSSTYVDAGAGGFYLDNSPTPNPIPSEAAILTDDFWSSNPHATLTTPTGLGNVIDANPPLYIIQKLPSYPPSGPWVPGTSIMWQPYKVTVRATGGSTNAVVILQSIKSY